MSVLRNDNVTFLPTAPKTVAAGCKLHIRTICNVAHAQHIILICNQLGVKAKRDNFLARYTEHVKSFDVKTSSNKIREILNPNPSCDVDCKESAKTSICAFNDRVHLCECEFDVRLKKQIGDMNVFLYIKQ